jgi:hypothetical protein
MPSDAMRSVADSVSTSVSPLVDAPARVASVDSAPSLPRRSKPATRTLEISTGPAMTRRQGADDREVHINRTLLQRGAQREREANRGQGRLEIGRGHVVAGERHPHGDRFSRGVVVGSEMRH